MTQAEGTKNLYPLNFAKASWYGPGFHGREAANGEVFDQNAMTFAHKSLPFGTKVRFYHDGKSYEGTCNDRGPFIEDRDFDLSKALAGKLGITEKGVGYLFFEVVSQKDEAIKKYYKGRRGRP